MNALDYRSWGETRNCEGCRFWSEMLAESSGGVLKAACLATKAKYSGKFTSSQTTCDAWQGGSLGAVDSPGGDPYTGMTLAEWCAQPHRGYGARVCDDELFVWVGGNPYMFPAPLSASCTIPVSRLAFFWRNRVADKLRMLRRSLSEG